MHYEDTREEAVAAMKMNSNSMMTDDDNKMGEETKTEALAGHCVALSLADLSVWCYECDAYL
eukprot:CAMPEP_0172572190 /NCGR_PEP_ID=MMETSP1067-20121228/134244_1 /TAXON_ID=265564 ORGANISM="Thalassiosira punctigera, Strain Tpunct2005C2" /NCGR_SAMPLE_ID=MMETSP1067 /ASSEMBLY_ACC=CAM_ASM_000444 /LENGTH=61 /DNA_ID=CAMNT_0013364683 /DNA_START=1 /DNA_END=182 /DNA_ORIENTATION=-